MFHQTTFLALVLLVLITAISQLFKTQLELINIALIHLLPVIIIALRGVMSATMIITTATVILFDLLYVPPQYSFDVHNPAGQADSCQRNQADPTAHPLTRPQNPARLHHR